MLRTRETAPHIPATTPIETEFEDTVEWFSPGPEDALELFRPEASRNAAAGPVPRSDSLKVELDAATAGLGSSSNRPTQRKALPAPVTEGPCFTHRAHEPAGWDLLDEPTDRHLRSRQRRFKSRARSRTLVWLLLSAPVAVSLVSWFPVNVESARRTAIEATGRVRSTIVSIGAQISLALQPGRPSVAGPPLAADRLERIPASPLNRNNENFSPEPTAEKPAYTSPSIEGTAPSPAPALSTVQASSPAINKLLAGTLTIDSRPVGASVFVDGQPIGTTPVLLPDISPGIHVVRLQLAAHREWISTVQVVPDDRNRVTAALEEDENAPEP